MGTTLHDWLRPRLGVLFREAVAAGFEREAVAAVMLDLVSTPPYDSAAPDPGAVGDGVPPGVPVGTPRDPSRQP